MPNDWGSPNRDPAALEKLAAEQVQHNSRLGLIPPAGATPTMPPPMEPPVANNLVEEMKALRARVYELEMQQANHRERLINLERVIGL